MASQFGGSGGFLIPISMEPQRRQEMPADVSVVPARVGQAMNFLSLMQFKELDRPGNGDVSGTIDGKELTLEERETQVAACKFLTSYFRGEMAHDEWDKIRHAKLKKKDDNAPAGKILQCIICNGHQGRACDICGGSGMIVVSPCYEKGER
jgi:hypothetical protein